MVRIINPETGLCRHALDDFANDTVSAVEMLKSPLGPLPKCFVQMSDIENLVQPESENFEETTEELPAELTALASKDLLLQHVDICSQDAKPGTCLGKLLNDVSELSWECFQENVVEKVRAECKDDPPLVLVLLQHTHTDGGELNDELLGFLVYKFCGPPVRRLSIRNVAIPKHFRGLGYGKKLTEWAMDYAKEMPRSQCGTVTCSALPEAIPFYQRLGWEFDTQAQDQKVEVENAIPGQVFMQYKCKRRALAKELPAIVKQTVLLEHVNVSSEVGKPGTRLGDLLEDVSELSWECFSEDVVEKVRATSDKNPPLLLVLLDRKEMEGGEVDDELLGFLVYQLQGPPVRWLSIDYVAVPEHLRGRGYGTKLTKWAMNHAKQLPRSQCASVTCSSPPDALPFYKKLGFEPDKTDEKVEAQSGISETVFIRYKCGREVAKANAKRNKSKK